MSQVNEWLIQYNKEQSKQQEEQQHIAYTGT